MSRVSAGDMQRLLATELSIRARLLYTALLLVTTAMSTLATALWITEPGLPVRTQVAFMLIAAIGLSWTAFAGWVLTTRRVLLALDQVLAARMAVAFCGVFVGGCSAVAWMGVGAGAYLAAGFGVVMLIVALALLARAQKRVTWLRARRRALEDTIARPAAIVVKGDQE